MKIDKGLKIALIILLIILISIISFVGIYVQEKKSMVNILKDYQLGMNLKGCRIITTAVDTGVETIYYDKDGNVVEEETEGGSKKEVPINSEETLTKENYSKTKKIIEKRLDDYSISEYLIRQDENTGKLTVQIPENSDTDIAIQYIYTVGKFTIVGENDEILLDRSNIKEAKAVYGSTSSGTTVYLNIEFNKDSIEKLKEISNTYVKATDSEGNETTKQISLKLDGSTLTSTSFGEEISNGILQISVGSESTDSATINSYLEEARNLAILINDGELPIEYTLEQNRYVASDITTKDIVTAAIIIGIALIVAIIILAIIYKKNGILVGIANIGYVAILLILIRYTNVVITIEGLFGIVASVVLNYIFSIYLLKTIKEETDIKKAYNKTTLAMLFVLVLALIVGITLCFAAWMPIYSFGALMFWGILTIFVYNTILTRTLLVCSTKNR